MRSDLTTDFITAKNAASRSPRQWAVFHFPVAGDVYISDQALGAAEGLSFEAAALVEDWGTLADMAGGDPSDKGASEIRQLTLTIWNGGTNPFSDYFLKEDPEELHNLIDEPEHQDRIKKLRSRMYSWLEGTDGMQIPLRREGGFKGNKRGPKTVKEFKYYGENR